MSGFMDSYFGPLSREYCLYFYLMSVFFFLMIVLGAIGIVAAFINKPKKFDLMLVIHAVMLLFNAILAYYVNRLLNTMCMNSTH